MMFFEIFEDLKFLKIFDPQLPNFKNTLLTAEISANPKILGIMDPLVFLRFMLFIKIGNYHTPPLSD